MRKWIPGFGWHVMRRWFLVSVEPKMRRRFSGSFMLSRKLDDGILLPEEMIPRKWRKDPQFLCRKWGDICNPVKEWKWGNGSLVSDDRLVWGDDGRPCWQPVTEFSHFPESFVPPSTTAGTVLSLYFFILLDIFMKKYTISLKMLYYESGSP